MIPDSISGAGVDPLPLEVFIPTYRRPQFLRRALASVVGQSYRALSIHVFDNCSGDTTRDVVEEFAAGDDRVHYVCHDRNLGQVGNVNAILAAARSKYFTVFSDDDLLLPDCLRLAVEGLEAHPHVALWGCNVAFLDQSSNTIVGFNGWQWRKGGIFKPDEAALRIVSGRHPDCQGMVFRTEAVRQVCPQLPLDCNLTDLYIELSLTRRWSLGMSSSCQCVMTVHAGSLTTGFPQPRLFMTSFLHLLDLVDRIYADRPQLRRRLAVELRKHAIRGIWQLGLLVAARGDTAQTVEVERYLEQPRLREWRAWLARASLGVARSRRSWSAAINWVRRAVEIADAPSRLLNRYATRASRRELQKVLSQFRLD